MFALSYLQLDRAKTAVNVTASQFKFSVFSVLYGSNIFHFRHFVTSACCLHNFVIKSYSYGILKATCKSRTIVYLGNLLVLWRTLFFRPCSFKRQVLAANSQAGETESWFGVQNV
jgi:hypothetical protein